MLEEHEARVVTAVERSLDRPTNVELFSQPHGHGEIEALAGSGVNAT
jgi:hypothetical protein